MQETHLIPVSEVFDLWTAYRAKQLCRYAVRVDVKRKKKTGN